jgi:cation:H+ antiporter
MFLELLLFLVGIGLLYIGAELLVRGAAHLAATLGIEPLVIGLTVVAFGTSAPEFVVTLVATLQGRPGIAIGNIIGSNIANIGLVLGLSAIVYPLTVRVKSIRQEVPFLLLITFVTVAFFWDLELKRWEGIALLGFFIAFIAYSAITSRGEGVSEVGLELPIEVLEVKPGSTPRWRIIMRDLILATAGIGALVGGSKLLISSATVIMLALGVSELLIGLTLVAVGTSLPEVATSVVSAFRRQSDICVGNVLGSNLFNLLFVLGSIVTIHPLSLDAGLMRFEIPVMVLFTVVVLPIMWTRFKVQRWEGILLLAAYVGFILVLSNRGRFPAAIQPGF